MTLRSLVVTALVSAAAVLTPVGATAATSPVTSCRYTPTPDNPAAKPVVPPFPVAPATGSVTLRMSTNYGPVLMKLDRANAPCGVHNFVSLALQRFYHGNQCWRLTDSERLGVLQCGDIYEVEKGGPGNKFPDEVTGKDTYHAARSRWATRAPAPTAASSFLCTRSPRSTRCTPCWAR
jgi:peptidyl-prolyl cis-trans isomerase B (cyclophilin B)